jgi:MFS family permease
LLRRFQSTYTAFPRQFWLIAAGALASSAGSSLVWPFQFIYISRTLALSLSTVATLISLSACAGLAVSSIGGAIADRLGRKPVMVAAQAGYALAWVLMSLARSYLGFLAALTLINACQPLYSVGSDAMMADLVEPPRRPTGYSVLRIMNNAGIALGPAIGGWIVARSYPAAFRCAAVAMGGYSLLLLFRVRESRPRCKGGPRPAARESVSGFRQVVRDRSFMLFAGLVTLGLVPPLMLWTLLALYTKQQFGLPEQLYAWLPMTNALMCVFVQLPVTRLTRGLRPLATLGLGMLIYAMGVGSVAVMGSFPGFWLSMVILTFGELIVMPTGTAFVANRAPVAFRGRYMSVFWMTWGLARALAPLAGGLLSDHLGPRSVWIGGLLIGLVATLGLALMARYQAQSAPALASEEPSAIM